MGSRSATPFVGLSCQRDRGVSGLVISYPHHLITISWFDLSCSTPYRAGRRGTEISMARLGDFPELQPEHRQGSAQPEREVRTRAARLGRDVHPPLRPSPTAEAIRPGEREP